MAQSEHLGKSSDKNNKIYSLIPDLITGWKPKNIKIPSPVIIKYRSPLVSQMLNYYQDERGKIIYIGNPFINSGPRYNNSLMYHEHISHEYILKYGITTDDIPNFLQKQLNAEDNEQKSNRFFEGMNPSLQDIPFEFNSHF